MASRRLGVTLAAVLVCAAAAAAGGCRVAAPDGPLTGLAAEELQRLDDGKDVPHQAPEGNLSPFFSNAASCAECHSQPPPGGFTTREREARAP